MSRPSLKEFSQAQRERLVHIDFKSRFFGALNRNDLVCRFGIKAAAATRDISLYKELAPNNLVYDTKVKTYIVSDAFRPLFEHNGRQILHALCQVQEDDKTIDNKALIPTETPTQLNLPNLDVLAEITKAIFQRKVLKIEYRSLTSGHSIREIVPFVLVDNGLRWHVRAFDRKEVRFSDFVINRISRPKILKQQIFKNETREADNQWNRIVEMHIVPHPRLKHPETIKMEYGMQETKDGFMIKVEVRAAVAGYVLRRWNVDCSDTHSLDSPEIHLWLQNHQSLYGVENLSIAPGYQLASK